MSNTWKSPHILYIYCKGEESNNFKYCHGLQRASQLLRLFVLIVAHCAQNTGGSIHCTNIIAANGNNFIYPVAALQQSTVVKTLHPDEGTLCSKDGRVNTLYLRYCYQLHLIHPVAALGVRLLRLFILMVAHCVRNMEESAAYTVHPLQRRGIQQLEILSFSITANASTNCPVVETLCPDCGTLIVPKTR